MKYLFLNFTIWVAVTFFPLCITVVDLDAWMPESTLQKKEERKELTMNPLFIFK